MSTERKRRTGKNNRLAEIQKPRGFERGLDIDEIVGVTDYTGDLMYLIRWQNCDELDLLPASEINDKNPDLVITFYEKRCPLLKQAKARAALNVPIAIREPKTAEGPEPAAEPAPEAESGAEPMDANDGAETSAMEVDNDVEEVPAPDTSGGAPQAPEPEGDNE